MGRRVKKVKLPRTKITKIALKKPKLKMAKAGN